MSDDSGGLVLRRSSLPDTRLPGELTSDQSRDIVQITREHGTEIDAQDWKRRKAEAAKRELRIHLDDMVRETLPLIGAPLEGNQDDFVAESYDQFRRANTRGYLNEALNGVSQTTRVIDDIASRSVTPPPRLTPPAGSPRPRRTGLGRFLLGEE